MYLEEAASRVSFRCTSVVVTCHVPSLVYASMADCEEKDGLMARPSTLTVLCHSKLHVDHTRARVANI